MSGRRFIFVVGGAGLFTFLTAAAGLIGSARNSHAWLAVYAFMAVLLLLAQVSTAFLASAPSLKDRRCFL